MSLIEIIQHPNEILTTAAKPIIKTDKQIIATLFQMAKYVTENENAVGLALPQIGISKRGFVMKNDEDKVEIVINPVISNRSDETIIREEACLSVQGIVVLIERPKFVEVTYSTPNFKGKKAKLSSQMSQIFQHEFDHLNGILITSKGSSIIIPKDV